MVEAAGRYRVVGEASDGIEAIERARSLRPEIVVLDLAMPELGGVGAIVELRRVNPDVEILVFTHHQSDIRCRRAIDAGARAFVCKSESEHLEPALEAVSRGQTYLSPFVREPILQLSRDEVWERQMLTEREVQVVRLVAQGNSNKEIARKLKISVKTTETHRAAAMRKSGSHSASSLTIYAARNGIVDL
jgi:DNA-binding NarL/FixJ family response regulator